MPRPVPAIDYRTLAAAESDDLDVQVKILLQEGWSLWGNPYAMSGTYGWIYCQAMILLEDA